MKLQTKQRLLGGLVLLAIAAIFLPLLFHHSLPGIAQKPLSAKVPAAPNVPVSVFDLPLQGNASSSDKVEHKRAAMFDSMPESEMRARAAKTNQISAHLLHSSTPHKENLNVEPVKQVKDQRVTATITAAQQKDSTRDLPKNQVSLYESLSAVPKAWVVQLASFGDRSNATHLVDQLKKLGMDAFMRSTSTAHRVITRVYVGPYIELTKVKALQRQLVKQLHLKGVIKKYSL